MNIDDPKLTAFALDELDEPERSTIARAIAESPEAQRAVAETREMARQLKNEFASELNEKTKPSLNLSDIRDDPWFWGIGRPLAIAAILAVFAVLSVGVLMNRSRSDSGSLPSTDYTFVEGEQSPPDEIAPEVVGPEQVPNPWSGEAIKRIDHVVVGELPVADSSENELRIVETIRDPYRVQHLKERMAVSAMVRKPLTKQGSRAYTMMFIARDGRIIAGATFCSVGNLGFVLQPLKNAFERGGKFFIGGDTLLPADWKSDVDYRSYVIQFPDWKECIGYAPRI